MYASITLKKLIATYRMSRKILISKSKYELKKTIISQSRNSNSPIIENNIIL